VVSKFQPHKEGSQSFRENIEKRGRTASKRDYGFVKNEV